MAQKQPLLSIRFEGRSVGSGRIPVAHLLQFLSSMTKVLQRTGRILAGDADSVRRGPNPRGIKEAVALELVSLTHGSPVAVLGFDRLRTNDGQLFPESDRGMEILETAIKGLSDLQEEDAALPAGFDAGVLMAWRDAGTLFSQGIDSIEFTLNHRRKPTVTKFTPCGFARIQERIKGPRNNIRTVEGRLLMADFKEHGTRCRVHPAAAEPVLCLFDDDQKDEVLENILKYVRIVGEAKEDPVSGRITTIKIHDIERLEDQENEATELLPQGTPVSRAFWESPTLDELAESQNVGPLQDIRALFGTWLGEIDDGFEKVIDELRRSSPPAGGRV